MANPSQPVSSPFRPWVPRWLQLTVAFLCMVPIMMVNGGYTGSILNISGSLGVLAEDIYMSYYTTTAGMAIAYAFIPLVRPKAPTKFILITSLSGQILFCILSSVTPFIEIVVASSFIIGFLRGFVMIEIILIIMPTLSPSGTRNEFYSKFYPIILCLSQSSLVFASEFAHFFEWQYMFYFMAILLLFALTAVFITMDFQKRKIELHTIRMDWHSVFQISLVLVLTLYIFIYGKTSDWFNSTNIILACIFLVIASALFIHRQLTVEKPLVDLRILKNKYSTLAYLFSSFMMFFCMTSILNSSYVNYVLRLGTVRSNELYLWMVPGIILGGVASYYAYKKQIRLAWMIFLGFTCFAVCFAIMYFEVSPTGQYEDLFLPTMLRGMGMSILFITFSVYGVKNLHPTKYIYNGFYIVSTRSTIAAAMGYSILSNWLYYAEQKNNTILASSVDMVNPYATSAYTQSLKTYLSHGLSVENAKSMALNSLYGRVQIQSITVSLKEIFGYLLIVSLVILLIIALYFFKFAPVRLIKAEEDTTE